MNERRVAVKSCHSSGKTFLAADIVLWWVSTHPDGVAVTTAPTWTQVEKILWREIRNTVGSPTTKIKFPDVAGTELKFSDKNYAIGLSTNNAARFQGFKGGHILIVLDEAPGVRPEIWEAIAGLRAGGVVRQLAIGNPVIVGGDFYDIFTTKRGLWSTRTISAFDTPNLSHVSLTFPDEQGEMVTIGSGRSLMDLSEDELDKGSRHYLCSRRWVKEMFEEWGPHHAYFQSRVLGQFPTQADNTLIPLSWLEKAKLIEPDAGDKTERMRAGLDVAGPGEAETCLYVSQGTRIIFNKAWPIADPRGDVVAALAPYKDELESINVDSIGIGYGMFLHLKDIFGNKVNAVNVGGAPRDKLKYVNAKAEYYWGLRQRFKAGEIRGLDDEKTIGQLTTIGYKHNSAGKIEIESKDDLAKRGVKSPDRAEALMLCFAQSKRMSHAFSLELDGEITNERQSSYRGAGSEGGTRGRWGSADE